MSVSPKDSNGEIFLANSQGWKEEAEAVIKDVKDQVKEIVISNKLEVSSFLNGRSNCYKHFWSQCSTFLCKN